MAKGFKHGAGGGMPLNFEVVGGTSAPAAPKENTIWVDTDQKITGWVFSSAEPDAPVEGMVWIRTGASSAVRFDALKKNSIHVYPLSAVQYVSGEWVRRTALSYQGGEWVEWLNILYDNGTENVLWDGAWTENTDHLYCLSGTTSASSAKSHYTREKIDLTDHKTLKAEVQHTGDGSLFYANMSVVVSDAQQSGNIASVNVPNSSAKGTVVSVDLSDIEGEYYIRVVSSRSADGKNKNYVYKVWLE